MIPVAKTSVVSCLKDYHPIWLTSIVMKCFERLVKPHITASLPASYDPYQFAYYPSRSTEDAISTTLHSVITHLDQKDTYARILYIQHISIQHHHPPENNGKTPPTRPEHRHMSLDPGLSDGETSVWLTNLVRSWNQLSEYYSDNTPPPPKKKKKKNLEIGQTL